MYKTCLIYAIQPQEMVLIVSIIVVHIKLSCLFIPEIESSKAV